MILVLHHDTDSRRVLVRVLRNSGFDAAALASGVDALAAMRRQKPRLLILNGTLSDMDGIELLRRIRADEILSDLPVGFMSRQEKRTQLDFLLLSPAGPASGLIVPFGFGASEVVRSSCFFT